MNSVQESKQELEAAIRYAENAISSAKQTIESMEFRQEMAKKQSSEQTGREQALEQEIVDLNKELQRMQGLSQRHYDNMMTFKEERDMLEKNVKYLRDENERLKREKEASSGPCGCQAYRDLEERVDFYDKELKEMVQGAYTPTMPVIPKAVAIAIFREGMQHGVESACTELEGQTIEIDENEYCGGFEVTFTKEIDLEQELDLDWMRGKVGNYSEEFVVDALSTLCSDKEFECRIHGVDDEEILRRDWKKKDD